MTRTAPVGAVVQRRQPGRWRALRWAPATFGIVATAEVAIGGANDWATRPAAALVNLALAAVILLAIAADSRFWRHIRLPSLIFIAALAWAALPRLLPAPLATWFGIPPSLAADRTLPELAEATSRLTLVLAACAVSYRLKGAWPVIQALVVAGTVYLVWLVVMLAPWQFLLDGQHRRFAATIGNWNAAGVYFGIIAILSLAMIQTRPPQHSRLPRWAYGVPLVLNLLFCVATLSRSALTLTVAGLAIGIFWQGRSSYLLVSTRRRAALIGMVGMVTMMLTYLSADALFPRYLMLSTDSLSRWDIVTTYFDYTLDSPLWGFGPGSFFDLNRSRLDPATALRFWNFGAAHNAPLQIALEAGWPAVGLLALAVTLVGRSVARCRWSAENVGLLSALTVLAGAAMVDIAWNVPAIGAIGCILFGALWGNPDQPGSGQRRRSRRRSWIGTAGGVPATS